MNDTPLAFAMSEARGLMARRRFWFVLSGVVVVVALTGPFGTYMSMTLAERFVYWTLVTVGSFALGLLTSMTIAGQLEDRGVAPQPAVGVGSALAGLPISLFLGVLHAVFLGRPFLPEFLGMLPYVCVIAMIVAALYELVEARESAADAVIARQGSGESWLARLPRGIGTDLISLQAQDHYVLARTMSGEALVRSSMSDAERDLSGLGLRVHRSWWVASAEMERMVYRGGATKLLLKSGAVVPVGRAYRRSVRGHLAGQIRKAEG